MAAALLFKNGREVEARAMRSDPRRRDVDAVAPPCVLVLFSTTPSCQHQARR